MWTAHFSSFWKSFCLFFFVTSFTSFVLQWIFHLNWPVNSHFSGVYINIVIAAQCFHPLAFLWTFELLNWWLIIQKMVKNIYIFMCMVTDTWNINRYTNILHLKVHVLPFEMMGALRMSAVLFVFLYHPLFLAFLSSQPLAWQGLKLTEKAEARLHLGFIVPFPALFWCNSPLVYWFFLLNESWDADRRDRSLSCTLWDWERKTNHSWQEDWQI